MISASARVEKAFGDRSRAGTKGSGWGRESVVVLRDRGRDKNSLRQAQGVASNATKSRLCRSLAAFENSHHRQTKQSTCSRVSGQQTTDRQTPCSTLVKAYATSALALALARFGTDWAGKPAIHVRRGDLYLPSVSRAAPEEAPENSAYRSGKSLCTSTPQEAHSFSNAMYDYNATDQKEKFFSARCWCDPRCLTRFAG